MINYKQFNINPKGRRTADCAVRAVANVLNISWDEALDALVAISHKTKYEYTTKQVVSKLLESKGYIKMKQPRTECGSKIYVRDIDLVTNKQQRDHKILVSVANHWTVINGDNCEDIWDCRYKCIGNYWVLG